MRNLNKKNTKTTIQQNIMKYGNDEIKKNKTNFFIKNLKC